MSTTTAQALTPPEVSSREQVAGEQVGSEDVLGVVVTFNPEIEALAFALQSLADQVGHTVVVDNHSANRQEIVQKIAAINEREASERISLLAQSRNSGLGAAHNSGIAYAKNHGYTYVLLLDQDSVPLQGMAASLLAAVQAKSAEKVCAVGATYLNADNGSESFFVKFGWLKFRRQYCAQRDVDGCIAADFLISSGSLLPLSAVEEIGVMDEGLFIDHVDTEWFLRARNKGWRSYGVCDAVMQHGLGEMTHRISLGRQRNVPQHKPFRYYYIFRNSMVLYKRGYASWKWKWNDVQRLLLIMLMFGLWKTPRKENLRMMWRGIWHGLKGVSGPMPIASE